MLYCNVELGKAGSSQARQGNHNKKMNNKHTQNENIELEGGKSK